jgi:hypothetical protein
LYVEYTEKETLKFNNCKQITLLNIASTVFAILLNKRLSDLVKKIGRMSNGISSNKIDYCQYIHNLTNFWKMLWI